MACPTAADLLKRSVVCCRRMADSVAAATPALDCSSDTSFYEPLVGLRLGALFGILAVSSIGGTSSWTFAVQQRFSSCTS